MSDSETLRHLDRVYAGLEANRQAVAELSERTTAGFGSVSGQIGVLTERVDAHLREDERRFAELDGDVARAHAKAAGAAQAVERQQAEERGARRAQIGLAATIGGGIAAAIHYLATRAADLWRS